MIVYVDFFRAFPPLVLLLFIYFGAPFLGLDEGESLQPATMMFRLGPIDFAAFDGMSGEAKAMLNDPKVRAAYLGE